MVTNHDKVEIPFGTIKQSDPFTDAMKRAQTRHYAKIKENKHPAAKCSKPKCFICHPYKVARIIKHSDRKLILSMSEDAKNLQADGMTIRNYFPI